MKVLIVDDSLVFRSMLKTALVPIAGIEVVGSFANGRKALEFLENQSVDLVLLDVEIPGTDSLEVLKSIQEAKVPPKVVILAPPHLTSDERAREAIRLGADDVAEKPENSLLGPKGGTSHLRDSLIPKIVQFLNPTWEKGGGSSRPSMGRETKQTATLQALKPKVIVMACSTGGPKALERIFSQLSGTLQAPILLVQHMPPVFTRCLAERLSAITGVPGGEAANNELLMTSRIYVAPGGYHLRMEQKGDSVRLQLDQSPPLNHVRPSADPLFESAAEIFGNQVLGVILTGMGEDGANGAQAIKSAGGIVVAQDSASCVVDGMPRAAKNRGAVDVEMGLEEIAALLRRYCSPVLKSA